MPYTFETIEEIRDFLTTDGEGKTLVKECAAATGEYADPTKVAGLEANKNKILKEKKDLQEKFKEIEDKTKKYEEILDNVNVEEYNRLKEDEQKWIASAKEAVALPELEKAHTNEINGLNSKLNTQANIYTKEKAKLQEEIEAKAKEVDRLNGTLNDLLIDNSLQEHLNNSNVSEEHRELLLEAFRGRASVEFDEFDMRQVFMKESSTNAQIQIKDWFTAWATSETSKPYIKAPLNTGGGSRTGKGYTRNDVIAMQKEYAELVATGRTNEAIALNSKMFAIQQKLGG
ncbi:MAG: hypothetical protein GY679_01370 [Mycoplasma sp.]|nr:hypothetical protein [Mycoplasma sp.]